MALTTVETPNVPSNSTVARLARAIAERLDPDDEYDCEVSITTTAKDSIDDHGASDISTGGYEYLYTDYGVELTISFEENTDCPNTRASRIVREFSDSLNREHGVTYLGSFDGAEGHYHALAFPVLDKDFTCGVTEPHWA